MTTIFEVTADALATLTPVPFGHNTYHSPDGSIPDLYLAYQTWGTPEEHADDAEVSRTYRVQVTILSKTGLASLPDVDGAMLAAGFTIGPERELPQDISSGHYILAKDYFILLNKE
jgi:hypothetical protein